jgi:hypothetical protein
MLGMLSDGDEPDRRTAGLPCDHHGAGCCSADDGSELRADFLSRFEQPTTGITSCPVFAVHLQDRTAGRPTAWEWTFGDGSTSSEQNPTRDTNAVVAEVTLTASRGDVEDSVTKVISTPEC